MPKRYYSPGKAPVPLQDITYAFRYEKPMSYRIALDRMKQFEKGVHALPSPLEVLAITDIFSIVHPVILTRGVMLYCRDSNSRINSLFFDASDALLETVAAHSSDCAPWITNRTVAEMLIARFYVHQLTHGVIRDHYIGSLQERFELSDDLLKRQAQDPALNALFVGYTHIALKKMLELEVKILLVQYPTPEELVLEQGAALVTPVVMTFDCRTKSLTIDANARFSTVGKAYAVHDPIERNNPKSFIVSLADGVHYIKDEQD